MSHTAVIHSILTRAPGASLLTYVPRIAAKTRGALNSLSAAQKRFFFATILGFFKHFEMMYAQCLQAVMDEETWNAWSTHIRMEFHQPAAQQWWKLRKEAFTPAFREYLDASTAPEMRKFVHLLE